MKLRKLFLTLLLLGVTGEIRADNRIHDYTQVDVIEHNMVWSNLVEKRGMIGLQQLISYREIWDSEAQGLVCGDWESIDSLDSVYAGPYPNSIILTLKNGALIICRMTYSSITYQDEEQRNHHKYGYFYDSSLQSVRMIRKKFVPPPSIVLPPSELDYTEMENPPPAPFWAMEKS